MFNKPTSQQSMLEVEEDTQYGLAKEALLMQLRSMTTLLSHARARMENNFGFCFLSNKTCGDKNFHRY